MSQDRYYEALYDPETGGMTLRPKWRLNAPGYARAPGTRGEIVVGSSGEQRSKAEAARLREAEKKAAA